MPRKFWQFIQIFNSRAPRQIPCTLSQLIQTEITARVTSFQIPKVYIFLLLGFKPSGLLISLSLINCVQIILPYLIYIYIYTLFLISVLWQNSQLGLSGLETYLRINKCSHVQINGLEIFYFSEAAYIPRNRAASK